MQPVVRILGTHGVPAAYGGFETAAENVGRFLRDKGWRVVVYCQVPGDEPTSHDNWDGLERVLISERRLSWRGTASFDLKSIRHAMSRYRVGEVWLTFGYNTGIFNVAPRLRRIPNVINMDGMEWTRKRWGVFKQGVLLANERVAGVVGNTLIADHPVIAQYLRRHFGGRRIQTIAYGAYEVSSAPTTALPAFGLKPGQYGILVCRPIPENSVFEIVSAWSRKERNMPLLVVGPYDPTDPYHAKVMAAASSDVRFPGAIFDTQLLQALRFHAAVYLHGHTVGGTNPSLVEAMAAGNAVLAHKNAYNKWVAGPENAYFADSNELCGQLDVILPNPPLRARMGTASRSRFRAEFTWEKIGAQYETVLLSALRDRVKARKAVAQ